MLTPGVAVRTAGRLGTRSVELHLEHIEQGRSVMFLTSCSYMLRPLIHREGEFARVVTEPELLRRYRRGEKQRQFIDADLPGMARRRLVLPAHRCRGYVTCEPKLYWVDWLPFE